MQSLVLVVQNSFPDSQVGTATASNSFFREIGASLGGAVVGALLTSRLTDLLASRLPGGAAGDTNSLIPAAVNELTNQLRDVLKAEGCPQGSAAAGIARDVGDRRRPR